MFKDNTFWFTISAEKLELFYKDDRVFANVPGDWGSISGRVIPKTQKMVLDTSLLNTQHYKVRFKGKVAIPGKEYRPPPTSRCSSY